MALFKVKMSWLVKIAQTSGLLSQRGSVNKLSSIKSVPSVNLSTSRKEKRRFYKSVNVAESFVEKEEKKNSPELAETRFYEINLDKKKLRTPAGKLFKVDNELLAQMISQEWSSQVSTIKQNTMHLTSIVNTCLDNPNQLSKEKLIKRLTDYLSTDTLLYFDCKSIEKLDTLQETRWRPVVDWFNQRFPDLGLKVIKDLNDNGDIGLDVNSINPNNSFARYLEQNFNLNTLIAFDFMAECFKSVILTVALLERRVTTVDEACMLANLEQEHQYEQWGKVEWYHDVNEVETKARVSAGLLFIYLSNSSKYLASKTSN